MRSMFRLLAVGVATALSMSPAAHAAGSLELVFVQPDKFTDFGRDALETERMRRELQRHLERRASQILPDGRSLQLELLDIDRVGALRPIGRLPDLVRVVKSPADWPVIRLRYELRDGERVIGQGEERLADMNFERHLVGAGDGDPLALEKRMLDRWLGTLATAPPPG